MRTRGGRASPGPWLPTCCPLLHRLYDNLQKYDLPTPQSVFELDYFRERPDAFYLLARELWPDNYTPTPVHYFVKLLHDKGMLLRCFTQNIDSLEAATGLPRDKAATGLWRLVSPPAR